MSIPDAPKPEMEFKKLDPLPRYIRRLMLKQAIKAGKEPYAEGYEKGYEAAKTVMFEAGFRAGYNAAGRDLREAVSREHAAAPGLVQPVSLNLVAPDGSKLVVSERQPDYQPSEDSPNDSGVIVVSERT